MTNGKSYASNGGGAAVLPTKIATIRKESAFQVLRLLLVLSLTVAPFLFTKTLAQPNPKDCTGWFCPEGKESVCPGKPTEDRQIMFTMYDVETGEWVEGENLPEGQERPVFRFSERGTWICYGVKPAENRSGALSIRVSRYFEGMPHNTVRLYRNRNFFKKENCKNSAVTDDGKETYENRVSEPYLF
uniref:Uncharacterized protein n=1 Tax=Candidatus Kentrum sp. LFY TaxID=2126342 RepID=A0A450U5C3_9GAMM|nr:MAG: hypothetical protein BECKLFY1418B_GA0070995_10034 [Candidatus Kentron sp. LFY]